MIPIIVAPKKIRVEKQKNHKEVLSKKSFIDHVTELRSRLFLSAIVLIISSIVGYFIQDKILSFLLWPFNNQLLYYTSPAGGFNFILELSIFFGFIVSLPFFIFQILRFIEPVIPNKARFSLIFLLLSTCFLMILGMLFAYFFSLPAALYFLNEFSSNEVKSLISASEYFSFVTRYLIGFGLLFQLPLIMVFINRISPLTLTQLLSFERWIFLFAFILAAILTPTPDLLNQVFMALPIIILYQLSVLLIWFINRK